ncbi:MAG: DUF2807 domain-containing protein [Bacteroidia bacterium]
MKILQFTLTLLTSTILFTSCFNEGSLVCTRPNGESSRMEYPVENFDQIELQMAADVVVIQGDEFKVEADAAENIHNILVANVTGNELTLRTERGRCIRGRSEVTFYVTCPDVEAITLSGSGNITNQGVFNGQNLELRISGSGNINLQEFDTEDLMVSVSGSGDLELDDFNASNVELKTSGSGKIEFENAVLSQVDASITGSGKVNLKGQNASYCNINISGSGKVEAFEMPFDMADVKIGGSGNAQLYINNELNANITGSGDVYYMGSPSVNANITGSGKVQKQN